MDCESRIARATSVALASVEDRTANHDRLRSRSRTTRQYRAVRPGRALGAIHLRPLRPAKFCENVRIERYAALHPTEYKDDLRRDQAVCSRDRAPPRTGAPRTGRL